MSVTGPAGFRAAGVACGIKERGVLDLALVAAAEPVPAAAVFTVNRAAAAPVRLSREHLAAGRGVRGVLLNSGCANAGTGAAGSAAARASAAAAAGHLGGNATEVLVASTGPIGPQLPFDLVLDGIGHAVAALASSPEAGRAAAEAIMTTDTVPKEAFLAAPAGYAVGGMAKGAGMIRPDMATMLAVLTTDAAVPAPLLDTALRVAVDETFHALDIDGCASTNDTVVVLASGKSGVTPTLQGLAESLTTVAADLARQLAADAEGADRVVTIDVTGAADAATARNAGRAIADSALVRASFYGGDPNWGRLLGALGASGIDFDPAAVSIAYQGIVVATGGSGAAHDERALLERLGEGDFTVEVTIGDGPGAGRVLTTDLTPAYVRLNGERS